MFTVSLKTAFVGILVGWAFLVGIVPTSFALKCRQGKDLSSQVTLPCKHPRNFSCGYKARVFNLGKVTYNGEYFCSGFLVNKCVSRKIYTENKLALNETTCYCTPDGCDPVKGFTLIPAPPTKSKRKSSSAGGLVPGWTLIPITGLLLWQFY